MSIGTIDDAKRPPKPNPNFRPTTAQAEGYAARKVAQTNAAAEVTSTAIAAFGAVAKEVVGVAKSNPIMGIFLAVVGADMLYQAHLITAKTEAFIFMVCGVAFGVTVSLEVVEGVESAIAKIDPFSQGGTSAPDPSELIKPTATTIVENPPTQTGGVPAGALMSAPTQSGATALTALIPKTVPAA